MFKLFKRRSQLAGRGSSDVRGSFRRNQTLTGTSSDDIEASAHNDNARLQSDRSRAHQLSARRRRVSQLFVGILLIGLLIMLLLSQLTARVNLEIDNAESADVGTYTQVINQYLEANPLERLRFALDKDKLLSYINLEYPEVGMIETFDMDGFGSSRVVIAMRQPVASWKIGGNKYFVDDNGVAFIENYFSNPSVSIVDESGISVDGGEVVASNRFLSFVGKVVSAAKTYNYTVLRAIIPNNTTRQLDIKLKDTSYRIKLSVDRPAGEQVEDMARAIKYLKSKGRVPGYLDVRVSGKAFYR